MRADTLDRGPSEKEFTLRLLKALIDHYDRMLAVTDDKDIRLDVPLAEQFDAETLAKLKRVVMEDDEELEDLFAAMEGDMEDDEELEEAQA